MKKWVIASGLLCGLLIVWMVVNPIARFGFCTFGLTVYNARPYPASDLDIRSDGELRIAEKTHDLRLDAVKWLLEPKPEVLIIAIGWNGMTKVDQAIEKIPDTEVRILKSGEARALYNQLKAAEKKVAIHYHATC
jgi:hypothetical protein